MDNSFVTKLKKVSLKTWVMLCVLLSCIVLFTLLTTYKYSKIDAMIDMKATKQWGPNSSHVSMFLSDNAKVDDRFIMTLRHLVSEEMGKLISDVSEDDSPFEGPFTYAYSATGKVNLSYAEDESITVDGVNVMGVGGDFFLFHPVKLISGRYFDETDTNKDSIILDSTTAGRLFGSSDIVDMQVKIANKRFIVRGVYEIDKSSYATKGGINGGYIFVPYETLNELKFAENINCIEFVNADPNEKFLYNLLNDVDNTGLNISDYDIVDNSLRFGIPNLVKVFSQFGARAMQTKKISYPYWENVARAYESDFAIMLPVQFVLLLIATVIVIIWICNFIKKQFSAQKIKERAENWVDGIRERRRKISKQKAREHAASKKEKSKWKDF